MTLSTESNQNNRKPRFTRLDAQIAVTIFAVVLAALALFVATRIDRRVRLDTDEDMETTEAEAILERANDAVNFADSILSFLEGASVVVGAALAVGAWMLRNSIQSQIEATHQFVEETQRQFVAREQELRQFETDVRKRLDDMVDQTRQQFETAQEQAADSFRVLSLLVLAEQQVRAHNIDTAIRTLEDAHEIDPDNQATNYLLGYLYTPRKQFDAAIARLERALELKPDFAPAMAALGLALRRKGDSLPDDQRDTRDRLWAEAETKLLDALNQDSRLTDADGESYYGSLGGLYRRQGRYDAALQAYERAHAVTPNSSYPIINLASLHKHQGNDERAAHFFERVLKTAELQLDSDPRDAWTRADYAQAKLVLGDRKGALAELRTVIGQQPERGLLETIRSGLYFLADAPSEIPSLDAMIDLLGEALGQPGEPAQADRLEKSEESDA